MTHENKIPEYDVIIGNFYKIAKYSPHNFEFNNLTDYLNAQKDVNDPSISNEEKAKLDLSIKKHEFFRDSFVKIFTTKAEKIIKNNTTQHEKFYTAYEEAYRDVNGIAGHPESIILKAIRTGDLELITDYWNVGIFEKIIEKMNNFLEVASYKKQDEIVKFLIEKGVGVNINSSLSNAILADSKSTAEILLKKGANPNFVDEKGMPLLSSAICKENSLTELLLKYGANPNAKSKAEKTSLDIAIEQENIDAIKILLRHGVSPEVNDDFLMPGSDICALLKLESAFRTNDISFNTINSHPIVKMGIEVFDKNDPFLSNKLITGSQIEEFVKWKAETLLRTETLNEYTTNLSYMKNLISLYEFCKTDSNILKSPIVKQLGEGISKYLVGKDIEAIKQPILTLKNMIVSKISDFIKDEEYKDDISILEDGLKACTIPLSGVHYETVEG
ncbi:MAG: ankyrin repeat domain-containing protein [Rickettsia endosymbiont of Glossina mortisans submortisans]|nr:ankyrin repeat domain-containing protein [Rickettsia endosymbiont of Glossina mortisans submortisans]